MSFPNTPKTASDDLESEHTTNVPLTADVMMPSTVTEAYPSSNPPPAVVASEGTEKEVAVAVIRTVNTVDSTMREVNKSPVSQSFDVNEDEDDDNDDFMADLINQIGWIPRGRTTQPTSPKPVARPLQAIIPPATTPPRPN